MAAEKFCCLFTQISRHFKTDGRKLFALFQKLLHNLSQINLVVVKPFFHINISISCDTDKRFSQNTVILENASAVMENNVLRKQKAEFLLIGQGYYTGKASHRRDYSQLNGIFRFKVSHCINILVFEKRKRVTLVNHLRGYKGTYLRIEIGSEIALLLVCKGGNGNMLHTCPFKLLHCGKISLVPYGNKLSHTAVKSVKLFLGSHSRFIVSLFIVYKHPVPQ